MKPVIDTTKEYGLVLEGGGAKGAWQIGAWKALKEAGVKIRGVAGTSVGALNGALICMGDLERAENLWKNIEYSQVMDVNDERMQSLFDKARMTPEFLRETLKEDVYKRQASYFRGMNSAAASQINQSGLCGISDFDSVFIG